MPEIPVLDALRGAVDGLLSSDFGRLSRDEFVALMSGLEVERRRLEFVDVRVLAEGEERRVDGQLGRASVAEVLSQSLRVAPREAAARVRRVRELDERRSLTGEVLPPLLPACAAALSAGEISGRHVQVISKVLDDLPSDVHPAAVADGEAYLVLAAKHVDPAGMGPWIDKLLAILDPDGADVDEKRAERKRELHLHKFRDGSGALRGRLTAELVEALETVMDSLAAPRPQQPDTESEMAADADHTATEDAQAGGDGAASTGSSDPTGHGDARTGKAHDGGMRDQRSYLQRWHDGLLDALLRVIRSGTLPAAGGVPAMLILHGDINDALRGSGTVTTSHGRRLTMATALRLAGDGGTVTGIRIDTTGAVLSMGRDTRLATRTQRIALAVRDGGCCFPGCDRPPAWTEVHHVKEWQHGGTTDLDNMVLVCGYHHRHFAEAGWQVRIHDGVPQWLAPAWIDPDQTWTRNRTHHPPDITFRHRQDPDAA